MGQLALANWGYSEDNEAVTSVLETAAATRGYENLPNALYWDDAASESAAAALRRTSQWKIVPGVLALNREPARLARLSRP